MGQRAPDMKGKVVVVTGANRGIGRETALALARMGATVELVTRDAVAGEATAEAIISETGNPNVHNVRADLASQRQVREAAEVLRGRHGAIDVLVNNAGATYRNRTLTDEGIEAVFAVNHLGYFLLTHLLLDRLRASRSARVINVSSEAHQTARLDLDDLQLEQGYTSTRAYAQSKLANIMFSYELARRLEGTSVAVNAVHPGVIATKLLTDYLPFPFLTAPIARLFGDTAEVVAEPVVWLASAPELEGVTGRYFVKHQERRSSDLSYDDVSWRLLWDASAELTGLPVEAGVE